MILFASANEKVGFARIPLHEIQREIEYNSRMLRLQFKKQDWILNGAVFFLGIAGLIALLSIGRTSGQQLFYHQLIWYAGGLLIMFLVSQIDWRPAVNHPFIIKGIYFFSLFLLGLTLLFAPVIRGTKGWLLIGPVQFQASELAKLALIVIFSSFWAKAHVEIAHLKNLAKSFFYFLFPAALIAAQPDLGSDLIVFTLWFGYLLVSGIRWRHLLTAFAFFLVGGFFLWNNFLADYQKERIAGTFYPERDPLGINYSVIQSKIAIGSAGFFGKGFGRGTQAQLGFLPEARTDFIFSAFTEEWGLLGGLLVIIAFSIAIFRIMLIGLSADGNFAKLFCLGAIILLASHFILNIGFNLGIFPVIGVSLPFMSYGGSNLLINLIAIGIVQGIYLRSKF